MRTDDKMHFWTDFLLYIQGTWAYSVSVTKKWNELTLLVHKMALQSRLAGGRCAARDYLRLVQGESEYDKKDTQTETQTRTQTHIPNIIKYLYCSLQLNKMINHLANVQMLFKLVSWQHIKLGICICIFVFYLFNVYHMIYTCSKQFIILCVYI